MDYVKDAALRFLRDHGFVYLPIEPAHLKNYDKVTAIGSYSEYWEIITNYEKQQYAHQHDGLTLKTPRGLYILYQDDLSHARRTLVVLHEIGHVECGHATLGNIVGYTDDVEIRSQQEEEANRFAEVVLAPSPVLAMLKVKSPYEIQELTGLPYDRARAVMADVHAENEAPHTKLKAAVLKQFSGYIKEQRRPKYRNWVTVLFVLFFLALGLFGGWINYRLSIPVVATTAGQSYHTTSCNVVQEKEVILLSTLQARVNGLAPCKICNP